MSCALRHALPRSRSIYRELIVHLCLLLVFNVSCSESVLRTTSSWCCRLRSVLKRARNTGTSCSCAHEGDSAFLRHDATNYQILLTFDTVLMLFLLLGSIGRTLSSTLPHYVYVA
jgi:hypothetical protein